MKKVVIGTVFMAALLTQVSAIDFSVWGGGVIQGDFLTINLEGTKMQTNMAWLGAYGQAMGEGSDAATAATTADGYISTAFPNGYKQDGSIKQNSFGGGGFVAFDATYVELGISIIGEETKITYGGDLEGMPEKTTTSTRMGISLLGKYPFELAGGKFTVFPLLGVEVMFMLHQTEDGDTNYGEVQYFKKEDMGKTEELSQKDYTYLAFKLGVGGDFNVTDHIFVRGEFLYGIRLPNARETAVQKQLEAVTDKITALPHGPQFKLGVGYKF